LVIKPNDLPLTLQWVYWRFFARNWRVFNWKRYDYTSHFGDEDYRKHEKSLVEHWRGW